MTGSETEKDFKQQEHQRERARVRTVLANLDPDAKVLPHQKEFGNPWSGPKDGKKDYSGTSYETKAKRK